MVATSVLDAFVQIGALLTLVIPIAVLAAGALVYYFKAKFRMALGIILVSLGSFGALLFLFMIQFSFIKDSTGLIAFSFALFGIELATLMLGILSLARKQTQT